MRSKALAQELFRSVRGDVSLLVVRPPPASPPGYEEDLDNLLDLPSPGLDTQVGHYQVIISPVMDIKVILVKEMIIRT